MTHSTDSVQIRKAELRRELLAARAAHGESPEQARSRAEALRTYLDVFGARCVALYISTGQEPDTAVLRTALREAGMSILLPVLQADNTLTFGVDDGHSVVGRRGIEVPRGPERSLGEADIVLVPALAVDRSGVRLGRGGGSYDRALAEISATVPIIALLRPEELLDSLPAEPHDVRVDVVAMPTGLVHLPRRDHH